MALSKTGRTHKILCSAPCLNHCILWFDSAIRLTKPKKNQKRTKKDDADLFRVRSARESFPQLQTP
jgi:hypothetical protein